MTNINITPTELRIAIGVILFGGFLIGISACHFYNVFTHKYKDKDE